MSVRADRLGFLVIAAAMVAFAMLVYYALNRPSLRPLLHDARATVNTLHQAKRLCGPADYANSPQMSDDALMVAKRAMNAGLESGLPETAAFIEENLLALYPCDGDGRQKN